jgi:hypothetical protein
MNIRFTFNTHTPSKNFCNEKFLLSKNPQTEPTKARVCHYIKECEDTNGDGKPDRCFTREVCTDKPESGRAVKKQ